MREICSSCVHVRKSFDTYRKYEEYLQTALDYFQHSLRLRPLGMVNAASGSGFLIQKRGTGEKVGLGCELLVNIDGDWKPGKGSFSGCWRDFWRTEFLLP